MGMMISHDMLLGRWRLSLELFGRVFMEDVGAEPGSVRPFKVLATDPVPPSFPFTFEDKRIDMSSRSLLQHHICSQQKPSWELECCVFGICPRFSPSWVALR